MKTQKTGKFFRVFIFDNTVPKNSGSQWITALETNNYMKAKTTETKYKSQGYSTSIENCEGIYHE